MQVDTRNFAVSQELKFGDKLPYGLPAQNRLQEILPHNISEGSILTEQKLFEIQIPTGDISKVMSKTNAPKLNFQISQTSDGVGNSTLVLNRSAGSCIYSLEVFHGSQRLVNIQEFDRVYNQWLDLHQSTAHTDFEKGCEVKTKNGYNFQTINTNNTGSAMFSIDLIGFLSSHTQSAIPLGLFKNAPLYVRVVFNKRSRITGQNADNVADIKVNKVSFTYNEIVLDSMTIQQVFGGEMNKMVLDTTGFETNKKIVSSVSSDATLIPTNAQSLKGVLTGYYQGTNTNATRQNPYNQSGTYQFKLGGDYYPNTLMTADTLYSKFVNEVRKVKNCVAGSQSDSLVDYEVADFLVGADLSVYNTCGKVIAGQNAIGRDLQHIQNFGASYSGEIFNVVVYDCSVVIENGQATLAM